MVEDCKDPVVKPAAKKSVPVLRMIVLAIVVVCSTYICLFCLKQMDTRGNPRSMKIELMERHCHRHRVLQADMPFVHYPEPTTYRRNRCACTPVRYFAILTTQRSGSGWFETLLNSHVNISSNGEIFSVKERRSNISSITKTMDKVYNLDWFSSASKNECTAAVGFKWMLNQVMVMTPQILLDALRKAFLTLDMVRLVVFDECHRASGNHSYTRILKGLMEHHNDIVEYFNRKRVHAIFLFRRNLLRRLVSLLANDHDRAAKQLNGTHKAHVHSRNEADVLAKFKPTINTKVLIPSLRLAEKSAADALESFKNTPHILLYYEDLVQNRSKLRDVQKFLGVPQRRLVSHHVKIHTKPLSEQVENWDDVNSTLKGTQYESFLNADYDM